jgi:hypothetical protein
MLALAGSIFSMGKIYMNDHNSVRRENIMEISIYLLVLIDSLIWSLFEWRILSQMLKYFLFCLALFSV